MIGSHSHGDYGDPQGLSTCSRIGSSLCRGEPGTRPLMTHHFSSLLLFVSGHNFFTNRIRKKKEVLDATSLLSRTFKSGRRGSNPRRPAWEASTLPLSYSRNLEASYTVVRKRRLQDQSRHQNHSTGWFSPARGRLSDVTPAACDFDQGRKAGRTGSRRQFCGRYTGSVCKPIE
jgi:hypothetical protein